MAALLSLLSTSRRHLASIEALEQRIAPATITTLWIGGSGNWTDPAHWDHGVPNNGDGSLNVYNAILDVAGTPTITIDTQISVSSLTNAEDLQVMGNGTMLAGDYQGFYSTFDNTGSITIGGTGKFTISNFLQTTTTAQLGAIHVNGGTFALQGAVQNGGATLMIDAPGGTWLADGARIFGGAVSATAGSKIQVAAFHGISLDAVTMNADVEMTDGTLNGNQTDMRITGGLTLNGQLTIGRSATVKFIGTQTLGGTGSVFFPDVPFNALGVQSDVIGLPVLTIASGMTIHGGSTKTGGGQIGDDYLNGAVGKIINQGTISADVPGGLTLVHSLLENQGTIEAKNGGSLSIENLTTNSGTMSVAGGGSFTVKGDHWTSTGTLTATGFSYLFLDGTMTALGVTSVTSSFVGLKGTLENTNTHLSLAFPLTIYGGRIVGGTVDSSFIPGILRGTLDGVTLNADLQILGNSPRGIDIVNGLTLNSTVTLGANGVLNFIGTQTLGGTGGTVVFTDDVSNALTQNGTAPELTIGSGVTIRGGSSKAHGAQIGYSDQHESVLDGTIINEGIFSADVFGKNLNFNQSALVNHGTLEAKNGGGLGTANLVSSSGTMQALTGGVLAAGGQHWTNTGTISENAASLYFDGTVATAGLGTLSLTNGFVFIRGTIENAGATLTLGGTATWKLVGGTILGGIVAPSNGSQLYAAAAGGTLDGVTMNANLALPDGGGTPILVTIKNGLTLNGTATLNAYAYLVFDGTQTLGGTGDVVLTDSAVSGLTQYGTTPTLTIGSTMTIHGGSFQNQGGTLGDSDFFGNIQNGTIVNEGTISADGSGTIRFVRSKLVNHGTIEATAGGRFIYIENLSTNSGTLHGELGGGLTIEGYHWTNTGTLSEHSGYLYLDGVFTTAGLGTLTLDGGQVFLSGKLENAGSTLTLVSGALWYLNGGTIQGGAVQSDNGSAFHLFATGGILDGVTMNAPLEVNDGVSGAYAGIRHGLTLNSIATVGENSYLNFAGSQTLDGTGAILFTNHNNSALIVSESGTTLTIGPSMVIHGGSAQADGAVLGYSSFFYSGGPKDITIVNLGKISADVNATSIKIPQGRFINAGIAEAINGGTLNAPALVPTEKAVLTKTSAPYAFHDADGTPVSVKWLGDGSVTLVRFANATTSLGDLYSITTTGSNLTSTLSITTTGTAGTTSVETVDIHGGLKSLTAPKMNLTGNLTSTLSVGAISLGQVVSGSTIKIGPRGAGDTKTTSSLTLDLVQNLQLTSATPLLSLTAVQWIDDDATPDVITAPSLGTLTIKAAASRGLAAIFMADLSLSGAGVLPKALTLGKATIGGAIVGSAWEIGGNAGPVTAGSTLTFSASITGSLVSLTTTGITTGNLHIGARAAGDITTATVFSFGSGEELSIHTGTPIKSLTALEWLDRDATADAIVAPSIGTLTIKGSVPQTLAGDFEAGLTLSGAGVAAKKPTLGAVTVAGKLTGALWTVTGLTTSVKAASIAADWWGNFGAPVGSITTTGNASGIINIGARPMGDTTSKTTLSFDTVSELTFTSSTPVASLTTRQWLDRDLTPDTLQAPSLGALTVKGGTVARPLAGDFEAGLTLSANGVAATALTLGTVSVKGKITDAVWAVLGNAGALTAGSTSATWDATFSKGLTSITATTISGKLHAGSIGTIKATALDGALIDSDASVGTVTLAKMIDSRVFAGVRAGITGLPQDNVAFGTIATIAKVVISGVAHSNDPAMVNSFIAAKTITSASITNFAASNNGTPYGLGADTIGTLTLKTGTDSVIKKNLTDPAADASTGGDDFFVRIV